MERLSKKHVVTLATALAGVVALAMPANAHTGHGASGLAAGLIHPIIGIDHLLAMVAVGVWSASQPLNRAWHGPLVFVILLAIGGFMGLSGLALPLVEPGIVLSVMVLGIMVLAAARLPVSLGLVLIGGFALLHGHAHGSEATGTLAAYMAGFLFASAGLHAAGYGAGRYLASQRYGLAASGLAISAAGLALVGA